MFRLRDSRRKGLILEFGPLCGLEEHKPDLAQSRAGLDTLGVETEGLGQPVPEFQSVSLMLEVQDFYPRLLCLL